MPFKVCSMAQKTKKLDPAYDQKSLVYRFQRHLAAKDFFKPRGSYLIACSGGADSVALFHLMRMAFPEARLALAHFNHGLRPQTAKRDESFVKKLAKQYDVPFFGGQAEKKSPQKVSIEELARTRRYQFLKTVYRKKKYDALLLAHHADDQAETVLMRMCQGTGPRGLEAIREVLIFETMRCVRPLLPFSKSELEKFLKEHRFDSCQDETNQSTAFLRNRIRLKVLPYLQKQINPQVIRALARIPEIVRDENQLIVDLQHELEKKAIYRVERRKIILRAVIFRQAHPALQFRALDSLMKRIDPAAGLLFENMTLVREAFKKASFKLDLPRGLRLSGDKKIVAIEKI